jgi:hypothetical protein
MTRPETGRAGDGKLDGCASSAAVASESARRKAYLSFGVQAANCPYLKRSAKYSSGLREGFLYNQAS